MDSSYFWDSKSGLLKAGLAEHCSQDFENSFDAFNTFVTSNSKGGAERRAEKVHTRVPRYLIDDNIYVVGNFLEDNHVHYSINLGYGTEDLVEQFSHLICPLDSIFGEDENSRITVDATPKQLADANEDADPSPVVHSEGRFIVPPFTARMEEGTFITPTALMYEFGGFEGSMDERWNMHEDCRLFDEIDGDIGQNARL